MRTVLDQYTRACSLLLADTPIGGRKVAAALAKGTEGIGLAQTMTVDNGPEFAGSTRSAGLLATAWNWIFPAKQTRRKWLY